MTWCLDWILTVMSIKLQNQVERGIRARLEEMIHPHIFCIRNSACHLIIWQKKKPDWSQLLSCPKTGMQIYHWGKKKTQSDGWPLPIISHSSMILPFRRADLLENSSPWWQGFCTRVKTKHLVFDMMGEAVILRGLRAAAHTCPLGQVSLDPHGEPSRISSVGARHWAGTGCCTWKTQSSLCTVSASWAWTNRQDPSLHGLMLKETKKTDANKETDAVGHIR